MNLIYISTKLLLLILTNAALSLTQRNMYVAVNNTATFTMEVDNNTACYRKQFVKNVTTILTTGHNISSTILNRLAISDSEDKSSCTVKIFNVSILDQGPYKFEPASIKFYLWVVRFEMVPTVITEGVDINVTCVVDSSENNNIDVYWIQHSLELNFSQSIVLPNVSRNDAGIYTCSIQDSGKTHRINTTITVQYPPDVAIHFIDDNLACTAIGSPSEMKFIYFEHRSLFGEYIRTIHLNSSDQWLSLNTFDDSGMYRCTASNGIKDKNGHVNISVFKDVSIHGVPVFLSDNVQVYDGNLGQSQHIAVNVYCHPICENISCITENSSSPTLSEVFDQKEATNMTALFHRAKVTVGVQTISITIQKLQERHLKQYTVIAMNTEGKSYFKFRIRKSENTSIPAIVWYIVSCLCCTTAICICRFVYICCLKAKKREIRKTAGKKCKRVQMKPESVVVELVSNQSVSGRRFVVRDSDQQQH